MECDIDKCDLYRVNANGGVPEVWQLTASDLPTSALAATDGYVYWTYIRPGGDKFLLRKDAGDSLAPLEVVDEYFCESAGNENPKCAIDVAAGNCSFANYGDGPCVSVWWGYTLIDGTFIFTDLVITYLDESMSGNTIGNYFRPVSFDGGAIGAQGLEEFSIWDVLYFERDAARLFHDDVFSAGVPSPVYQGPPSAVAIRDIAAENDPTYACLLTATFGDVDESGGANPVTFADITIIVDCFKEASNCTHETYLKADLSPCASTGAWDFCLGDQTVNFADISLGVDAFKGIASCPLFSP